MAGTTLPRSGRPSGERCGACVVRWAVVSAAAIVATIAPSLAQEPPEERARRLLGEAQEVQERAADLTSDPDLENAHQRDRELPEILARGGRLLGFAESALSTAEQRGSSSAFNDAGLLADRAQRELARYVERAEAALAAIRAERAAPPPPPPPLTPVEATPPQSDETAPPGPEETAPSPPEETAAAPSAAPPPSPPPPPSPIRRGGVAPRELAAAADAFFAGDYERAVELISQIRLRRDRTRAHAYLLRAAARYQLFLLGGETDYSLRSAAIDDVQACRRADRSLSPWADAFSPRFRDFFAATR